MSAPTPYALIRAEELPHIRLNRNGIWLRLQDIAEFIAARFRG